MLDTVRAVSTPEGIELTLRLAGPAPRALAWFVDFLMRMVAFIAVGMSVSALGKFGFGLWLIVAFLLEWLVPAAFEVWADGSTPGKKAFGLQVLHDDGTPVGWPAALVRNIVRAVDFLPVAYGFGLVATMLNRDFKRLGDIAAGTIVVYRAEVQRARGIPDAAPVPATVALTLEEQRAILDFAERSGTLTPERAREIAELALPVTGARPGRETERVLEVASFLSGRRK